MRPFPILAAVTIAALFVGCSSESGPSAEQSGGASVFPDGLLLTSVPSGAQPLSAAKAGAKVGDTITFAGQLAGQKQIFVDGAATMVVGDRSIEVCLPDEGCPTPWDACCTPIDERRELSATVQVVGDNGKPLPASLRGFGKLEEMKMVVVTGKVSQKNDDGVMVVDATGIYVGSGGS